MSPGNWLLAVKEALPDAPAAEGMSRFDAMGRLRLSVAWSVLILAVGAMLLIVAYLCRAWRRAVNRPLPPLHQDDDAWARKPLISPDDDDDELDE